MFVAIDKATAVRMYEKVRKAWTAELASREEQFANVSEEARVGLGERLDWMRSVDMAVVVSQSQNEIDDLKQKGLDILPHRERMLKEDLETKFKDPDDPLRLVFVCAMWITGFDVPTCSTMYLDKPMKNHTLMQTIARANRRAPGKTAGVIVDYVGVFQNLQKALAIYAAKGSESTPIRDKDELVAELEKVLAEARAFCATVGVDVDAIFSAQKLARLRYDADITVDPKTRAVIRVDDFRYSRDGSKYLAQHGRGTDKLRQFANQIGDMFLASPAWIELRDRSPDRDYIVDHVGKVTVRVPTTFKPELLGERNDEAEG